MMKMMVNGDDSMMVMVMVMVMMMIVVMMMFIDVYLSEILYVSDDFVYNINLQHSSLKLTYIL